MRLLFSELAPEYELYLSPYQVWAVLDEGETAATALELGFLPGAYDLSHFVLARSVRVQLARYAPDGRVRYVARRCREVEADVVPVGEFSFDGRWRSLCRAHLEQRIGGERFDVDRFGRLLDSPLTTHVLRFRDARAERDIGLVTLYVERPVVYYGVAVYDLGYLERSIGNHMMASALGRFAAEGFSAVYLGTCYSDRAAYKSRFPGVQFFNGVRWSEDRRELRFMLERQAELRDRHLLEFEPYLREFPRGQPVGMPGVGLPVGATDAPVRRAAA